MRSIVALDEPQQITKELMAPLQNANHDQPLLLTIFGSFQMLLDNFLCQFLHSLLVVKM